MDWTDDDIRKESLRARFTESSRNGNREGSTGSLGCCRCGSRHGRSLHRSATPRRAGRVRQVHSALDPLDQPRRLRRICNSRLRTNLDTTHEHSRSCRRSQVHWGISDRPNVSSDSHCRSSTRSDQVLRRSLCRRLLGIGDNLGIGILLENFGPRK